MAQNTVRGSHAEQLIKKIEELRNIDAMDALRKKYPVAIQEILDLEQEIKIDSELDLANDDDDVLEKLNFLNRASSNIVEIHKRNTIAINNMWVYDTIADPLHDTDNKGIRGYDN